MNGEIYWEVPDTEYVQTTTTEFWCPDINRRIKFYTSMQNIDELDINIFNDFDVVHLNNGAYIKNPISHRWTPLRDLRIEQSIDQEACIRIDPRDIVSDGTDTNEAWGFELDTDYWMTHVTLPSTTPEIRPVMRYQTNTISWPGIKWTTDENDPWRFKIKENGRLQLERKEETKKEVNITVEDWNSIVEGA